jgi:hypothetical protein
VLRESWRQAGERAFSNTKCEGDQFGSPPPRSSILGLSECWGPLRQSIAAWEVPLLKMALPKEGLEHPSTLGSVSQDL